MRPFSRPRCDFYRVVCSAGGNMCVMPTRDDIDQALCDDVAQLGHEVSHRDVRTLREYGAIETVGDRKGGRGKTAHYVPGSASVVAAIQTAMIDPTYRRKLHRAVLIAWSRGARVGTPGLRQAFHEHFDAEERSAKNLVHGQRVEDREPDLRFGPAFNRAIAAAQLGQIGTPDDLAAIERSTGGELRTAFWRAGQPDLLPTTQDANSSLGLAARRPDGSWQVLPMGEQLWEALALVPLRRIAWRAPRAELNAALVSSRSMADRPFEVSDLVTATNVPVHIRWLRRWHGEQWWRRVRSGTT